MKGKLIVIEGTDCSGKETQSKKLIENLEKNNKKVCYFCFPNYESPTGKIVGGPYLGKSYICDGWFKEKAPNVDSKVSSLYFAADRKYNINKIIDKLNDGYNVILDRYVYSNMAHQGGKWKTKEERDEMYNWLSKLEFDLLELPKADLTIFLHVPYTITKELQKNRLFLDENEKNAAYQIQTEKTYMELASLYNWTTIDCSLNDNLRSIEDISREVLEKVID